ncbi:glycosyltransferase [Longimicrobium sp.]|uniref:glycosyltransferase n=1 Tax=Longimicrobium sp. TaxID=2029185 RepID=UPI002C505D5D|nr:glycosyltransferase [Longimicrobium sp.]HSU17092.1 glycosyltransferase [Longimicrobium sp.]
MPEPRAEERLHVLFFTASLGGGGAEKHLVRVANHLDRGRFRVSVAVARGGGSYESELAPDVAFHPLPGGRMARAPLALRRLVRRLRPDLVCSFMDHANCVALASTAGLRGAPPVVAGVQVSPAMEFLRDPDWRRRALLRAIRALYPRAAGVVAISRGVEDEVARVVPRVAPRIRVIYNAGVDDEVMRLAAEPFEPPPGEGPVVLACGRLTEQKGFSTLLDAFALLRRTVPAARLWLVGEGELRGELTAQAAALGIADAVWMPGFRANPYQLMRAADVFALSSLWEGFGNVIVEAMAVGTPVVATDCPHGPAEIIRDGKSGLLIPPSDAGALAGALARVLGDGALAGRLREAGRARANDFAAPAIAAGYGRFFQAVAHGHLPAE